MNLERTDPESPAVLTLSQVTTLDHKKEVDPTPHDIQFTDRVITMKSCVDLTSSVELQMSSVRSFDVVDCKYL